MSRSQTPVLIQSAPFSGRRCAKQWAFGCLLAAALTGPVRGGDVPPLITDVSEFYAHQDHFGGERVPVDLQFIVNHYDAAWSVLFAQSGDNCFFIKPGKQSFSFVGGQRVRVRGHISVDSGLEADEGGVEILSTSVPTEPIEATNRLHEWSALANRLVTFEAFVDEMEANDKDHLRLDLIVKGRKVSAHVLTRTGPGPQVRGNFVRVTGVYTYNTSINEGRAVVEVWIPTPENITVLGTQTEDKLFSVAATPIENVSQSTPTSLVKVVGTVYRQDRGHTLTLRDATGQIEVLSDQSLAIPVGTLAEAVGYPSHQSAIVTLSEAHFRPAATDTLPVIRENASATTLRFADNVLALSPSELEKKPPVLLTGVVTWFHPTSPFFFVQDSTAGIKLHRPPGDHDMLNFGAVIKIRGYAIAGQLSPEIQVEELRRGVDSPPASARIVTLDQLLSGTANNQWVELTGFLRDVRPDGLWVALDFTTPSGEFTAVAPANAAINALKGNLVRARGVCTYDVDAKGESNGIRLLIQSEKDVQVDAIRPKDLSTLPVNSIEQVKRLGARLELNQWVRTKGIVTYQEPGRFLYLQDGDASLRVLFRETKPSLVGKRMDLVGLIGREGGKKVLREAVLLKASDGPEVPLATIGLTEQPVLANDGKLGRLSGIVANVVTQLAQQRLTVRVGQTLIECTSTASAPLLPKGCDAGSLVVVTGVCHIDLDDYHKPKGYSLLLRSKDDIEIMSKAPWLTLERTLIVTSGLAVVAFLGIGWVALLRNRVRKQTKEILEQRGKEARLEAELERSSRLESLGVLAGGIAHDFNNMLTVTVGNISLAMMESPSDSRAAALLSEAEQGALKARELTQQLLTFARGGDPVKAPLDCAKLVREAAEFASHGSSTVLDFDFDPSIPPALADKSQLSQVIHNVVIRALDSMVSGGKIRFSLRSTQVFPGDYASLKPGRYLKLAISDQGPGVPADQLGRIFDPYFSNRSGVNGLGLATARSIIKRHQGHIEASSRLDEGTTFTLWLPIAETVAPDPAKPSVPGAPATGLKILFMDDDEAIRRFALTLLARLGHAPTVVANGTEAVHAYAAAWEIDKPFDVVVLDLTVPGAMGGSEALEHLQNINPHVKAIVSSGYSSDPIMSEFRKHGFSAIVSKPYKISELAKAIQDVVSQGAEEPPASS